jgi:hypothetical protein
MRGTVHRTLEREVTSGSRSFTSPLDTVGYILLLDAKPGELSAHFIRTAALQRAQDDGGPVGTYVEVLNAAKACSHGFGKSELVLDSHFGEHDSFFQGNKEILPRLIGMIQLGLFEGGQNLRG